MRSLGIRVWLEANQHAVKDVQITARQLVQMFAEMFANLVFFHRSVSVNPGLNAL
tara:strand:- start:204 stop:368 length:165 start_codon:yes stop_codon:yes gene_type:complete